MRVIAWSPLTRGSSDKAWQDLPLTPVLFNSKGFHVPLLFPLRCYGPGGFSLVGKFPDGLALSLLYSCGQQPLSPCVQ